MKDSLRNISFNKFKTNPTSYLAVGIMCGLFLLLVMVLAFIDPAILIIAVPLLALPFIFASHVACYYLQVNQQISLTAYARYFMGFFHSQFRGSFRGLISLLKSLGFYIAAVFVAGFIFFLIFKAQYGQTFVESLNTLFFQYTSNAEFTYEELVALLEANDNMLLTFIVYISAVAIPLSMLAFIYYISFSSLSIYYRANVAFGAAAVLKMSVGNTYARHRSEMRKDWFSLNWPMLVLSFTGMIGFAILDLLIFKRIDLLPTFVIVGGVALLMFYLPFYFANMETIYKKYEMNFKEGNQEAIETILRRIQSSIDLSEEEKKNLEASLRGQDKEDEDK
ncbi:MAG: hypothetical protein IK028_02560 [Bacilli bacterium]|nr:hypothetical protein [Bacilli bacterium]